MNKKYIIGAVVIIVIVWLFSLGNNAVAPQNENQVATTTATTTAKITTTATAAKKTTTTTAPKVSSTGSYVVTYTNSGFSPATINVPQGKSVEFINKSDRSMMIASADLGGMGFTSLSQNSAVGYGGTFYSSLSGGTWHYMNRLNQGDRGTIVVQ